MRTVRAPTATKIPPDEDHRGTVSACVPSDDTRDPPLLLALRLLVSNTGLSAAIFDTYEFPIEDDSRDIAETLAITARN